MCFNLEMLAVSMWIIAGLLKVFLVEGNVSTNLYFQVTDGEGQPVCSVNAPSVVIYGVRRRVSCLLEHCVPTKACLSANYTTQTPGSANSFITLQLISSDLLKDANTTR